MTKPWTVLPHPETEELRNRQWFDIDYSDERFKPALHERKVALGRFDFWAVRHGWRNYCNSSIWLSRCTRRYASGRSPIERSSCRLNHIAIKCIGVSLSRWMYYSAHQYCMRRGSDQSMSGPFWEKKKSLQATSGVIKSFIICSHRKTGVRTPCVDRRPPYWTENKRSRPSTRN